MKTAAYRVIICALLAGMTPSAKADDIGFPSECNVVTLQASGPRDATLIPQQIIIGPTGYKASNNAGRLLGMISISKRSFSKIIKILMKNSTYSREDGGYIVQCENIQHVLIIDKETAIDVGTIIHKEFEQQRKAIPPLVKDIGGP